MRDNVVHFYETLYKNLRSGDLMLRGYSLHPLGKLNVIFWREGSRGRRLFRF